MAVVSLVALALPASVILYKLRTADILRQPIALAFPSLSPPHLQFPPFMPPPLCSVFSSLRVSFFCDSFIRLELKTHFSCHYLGLSPSSALPLHPLSAAHCPLPTAHLTRRCSSSNNFINLVYYRVGLSAPFVFGPVKKHLPGITIFAQNPRKTQFQPASPQSEPEPVPELKFKRKLKLKLLSNAVAAYLPTQSPSFLLFSFFFFFSFTFFAKYSLHLSSLCSPSLSVAH